MTEVKNEFIQWFRSAAPYIRVHRNKTFVVQFDDGLVYSEVFTDLVHDLALLNSLGIKLVLVYGARQSIETWLQENDQTSNLHEGIRVTDADTMELVKIAAGKLRVEIEAKLSMGLGNTPMSQSDLSITSGNLVSARPVGIKKGIDYQFTGEVRSIDAESIRSRLSEQAIVLLPPLGYSVTGEVFNLSAAALAAETAIALQADKLIYLVDGDGIQDADGTTLSQIKPSEVASLADKPHLKNNELLRTAARACDKGVSRVQFIDRGVSGAILQELFTRDGVGTMLSSAPYDVIRPAGVDDIAGILDLIEPLEQAGLLVHRSREKLELEIDYFQVMERDNTVIGCAALYPFQDGAAAELACFAIDSEYHNQGMGDLLIAEVEAKAEAAGYKQLFVLTTGAQHWFREKGFEESTLEALPVEKQLLYNYQRNSAILVKTSA